MLSNLTPFLLGRCKARILMQVASLGLAISLLSACSDSGIQPVTTLNGLQVQQFHSNHAGMNYRYCHNCVHFTQLKRETPSHEDIH